MKFKIDKIDIHSLDRIFRVLCNVCIASSVLLYVYTRSTLGVDALGSLPLSIRSPSTLIQMIFFALNLQISAWGALGLAQRPWRWAAAFGFAPVFGGFSFVQTFIVEMFLLGVHQFNNVIVPMLRSL